MGMSKKAQEEWNKLQAEKQAKEMYACKSCGNKFEISKGINDFGKICCPNCLNVAQKIQ